MKSRARQEGLGRSTGFEGGEREREREIERVRNELIILNRFYPAGGIVAAHPARVLYYQHDPTRYHPIGAATMQYSP